MFPAPNPRAPNLWIISKKNVFSPNIGCVNFCIKYLQFKINAIYKIIEKLKKGSYINMNIFTFTN
jgi:hypothetical protein